MNVKKAILHLPLLAMALLLIPSTVSAAEKEYVLINGTAYGEKIGLLHFDSRSADPTFINPNSVYVGPTKQFYNPQFIATGKNDPGFPFTGSEDAAARISTADADCTPQSCLLRGFIWSDSIGWIVLDGTLIKDAMNNIISTGLNEDMEGVTPGYVPADKDNPIKDPYTSDMYPRISKVGGSAAPLIGLAWNRHTGWIRLSSNYNLGTTTLAKDQTSTDWGAWLETSVDPVFMGAGKDRVEVGRKFHGYVWSEKLGWIKLGAETGDDIAFQAYTTWIPDDSAPLLLTPDLVWFSVGVNTGYGPNEPVDSPYFNANPSNVVWKGFTMDPQSNINTGQSKFYLRSEDNTVCPDQPDTLNTLTPRSIPMGPKNGSVYDLSVPNLGNVPATLKGYCKYTLSAKIYNGTNLITYIGPDYLTNPLPKANSVQKAAITVLVRSGNIDIDKTEVNPASNPPAAAGVNPPSVLGDGNKTFGYTVQLKDVNGNPIQSIDCADLYANCPKREVEIKADITNKLLFDLTRPPPDFVPYTTPLMANNDASGVASDNLTSEKSTLDVFWNKVNKIHSIYFASSAPNESYSFTLPPTAPILTLQFLLDQFTYTVRNLDPLPATSKKLDNPADPDNSPLSDDQSTVVPAYTIDKDNASMPSNTLVPVPTMDLVGVGAPQPAIPGFISSGDPTGFSKPLASGSKPATVFFSAPIVTDPNPVLTSGTLSNVLTVGLPADLVTHVSNVSDLAIFATSDNTGGLAIDNIFKYESKNNNASMALLEVQRIAQRVGGTVSDEEKDNLAWTDPIDGPLLYTRYELFDDSGKCFQAIPNCIPPDPDDGSCINPTAPCDAMNSPFHSRYSTSHIGKDFCYDVTSAEDCAAPNFIQSSNGTYAISGEWSIPQKFNKDLVSGLWEAGKIDRNDVSSFPLSGAGAVLPAVASQEFSFRFSPEKILTSSIDDIQLRLFHDIAYRYPGQMLYSVYTANPTTNYEVKDIRLEAKGTVVGERLSTGRKFDTVGTASTQKLQEQIRRNVSQLTSGLNESLKANCTFAGNKSLANFESIDSSCLITDNVSQTSFAYFEGDKDSVLELGDGSGGNLTVPDKPFTLIVKGGASLFIRNNLRYDPARKTSSLGIILIAENIGEGANVYLSPTPTNMVGSLYAEGSLVSCSDIATGTCADGTRLYYGGGRANVQDLKNQLFWQGSIASRNTIAGAGIEKKPDGIVCLAGDTDLSCAQRYDLDYLRRFTPVVDSLSGDSSIANGGRLSGGGCCGEDDCGRVGEACAVCSAGLGLCVHPDPSDLPSVVILKGGSSGQIDNGPGKSELSTFYIEPSQRATLTPPGFSLSSGQESTQTIR